MLRRATIVLWCAAYYASATPSLDCPLGWVAYNTTETSKCYRLAHEAGSHRDCATNLCGRDATLACVQSPHHHEWIKSTFSGTEKMWIGLYQSVPDQLAAGWDNWASQDCTAPTTFRPWADGEPNNWNGIPEGCGAAGLKWENQWVDAPCLWDEPKCLCEWPSNSTDNYLRVSADWVGADNTHEIAILALQVATLMIIVLAVIAACTGCDRRAQVDIVQKHGQISIGCPGAAQPGTVLCIVAPDKQQLEVTVPEGIQPGQRFQITYSHQEGSPAPAILQGTGTVCCSCICSEPKTDMPSTQQG